MFKKVLLVALSSAYLFGSDFWQVDFHQGTSIYNIENAKKRDYLLNVVIVEEVFFYIIKIKRLL